MASLSVKEQQELALSAAYEDDTPTPPGWRRKLIPHIGRGLVPARTDVVFIAPNGEEFKTKAQLQRYLKSRKGSPSLSQFIWITDETPRRSSRSTSKRTRSPPSKRKSGGGGGGKGVPLQERKETKRRHTANAEEPEGSQEKQGKQMPVESMDDVEDSPTWSSAKENRRKSLKGAKGRKKAKAETQSPEVSSKPYTSEDDTKVGEEEEKEDVMEAGVGRNGKEESTEELLSHETIEEDRKTENLEGEEQEAMSSHETMEEESRNSEKFECEDRHMGNGQDDAHMEDEEGSKDGTTMSLLGSDFSADGMEAESDAFDSLKKGSPRADDEAVIHGAEKDHSESTMDSKRDTRACPENGLVQAAK